MATATLDHPTNTIANVEIYDATPVQGNFTGEPEQHVSCALAMSTVIIAEGFAPFQQWNGSIQHDYLWALNLELKRAQKSLEAESDARMARFEARRENGCHILAGNYGTGITFTDADADAMGKLGKRLSAISQALANADNSSENIRLRIEGVTIISALAEGLLDASENAAAA